MHLRRLLVLGGLALATCAQPGAEEARAMRREFGPLLSPRFEAVRGPVPSPADPRLILLVLQKRRAAKKDFDSITAITFQSATRAIASFT